MPPSITFHRSVATGRPRVLEKSQALGAPAGNAATAAPRFLPYTQNPPPAANGREPILLLVLDLSEPRLYRLEINGGTPRQLLPPPQAAPIAPASAPHARVVYPVIAEALQDPGQILVCGKAGHAPLTTNHFIRWLARFHPESAARITGSLIFDETCPSPERLLAGAREFHARPQSVRSPVGHSPPPLPPANTMWDSRN